MKKWTWGLSFVALALFCVSSNAATQFSSADYWLYPGHFNSDGRTDLLYISKSPDKPSGIALADGAGNPQLGFQSWPSNYLARTPQRNSTLRASQSNESISPVAARRCRISIHTIPTPKDSAQSSR